MSKKLPHAKDWKARDINDWNVTTFHTYISDLHYELFSVTYHPMRGWQVEKGMLKNAIKTYGNEVIKEFIDETFRDYTPNEKYPGTSFGFMWTYRKRELQRIERDHHRKQADEQRRETKQWDDDFLDDWL